MSVQKYMLSPKQIIGLEQYSKSVLGEDNYRMVGRFYDSVVQSRAKYRVVLTRRCFNLLNVYYWCRKKYHPEDKEEFSSLFYSDNTLMSNIPGIAMYYAVFNRMPDILIIDDILIHGRTINKLLDSFISELNNYLNRCGVKKTREEVERDVLCFLKIKVMVVNNRPLLLKRQYIQRLDLLDGAESICDAVKWHDLSFKTSRLISENIFSNTAYILSMYEADENFISRRVRELGFVESSWDKRKIRNVWVKPLYRSDGNIAALYTIRLNQNSVDNKFSAVPFVITSDFDIDYTKEIFYSLRSDMEERPQDILGLSKLIPLILSYNLMLLILDGSEEPIKVDSDKIYCGVGNGAGIQECYHALLSYDRPFLTWEEFDSLILRATAESKPLTDIGSSGSKPIDELIAAEGEQLEKEAYLEYSGFEQTANYNCKPIQVFWSKSDTSSEERLADSVGDTLRLMDTGSLAISSQYNKSHFISCIYRAGEQSQFIHPKKYMEQLPALCEIERDCMAVREKVLERVRKMYGGDKDLCKALCSYINTLYDSGQLLADWDINYFSWAEIDFEKYPELKERSADDRIRLQMILNSIQRAKAIAQYRELYPEQ